MSKKSITILLFLLSVQAIFCASELEQKVKKSIELPYRPSLFELKSIFGEWPKSNPYKSSTDKVSQMYSIKFPEYIAALEAVFPNATWAVLGRDAAVFGNGLEAFYDSIGQKNRVKYLHASSDSFQSSNELKRELLSTNGFDPLSLNNPDTPPYILLDMTSFQEDSQITELLKIGWRVLPNAKKFNAISIGGFPYLPLPGTYSGHYPKNQITPKFDFKKLLAQQNSDLKYKKMPSSFFSLDTSVNGIRLFGYSPFVWNDSYGSLEKCSDGIVRGRLGEKNMEDRESILSLMYEMTYQAQKQSFLETVSLHLTAYGLSLSHFGISDLSIVKCPGIFTNLAKAE